MAKLTKAEATARRAAGYASLARVAVFTRDAYRISAAEARGFHVDGAEVAARTVDSLALWLGGMAPERRAALTGHYATLDAVAVPGAATRRTRPVPYGAVLAIGVCPQWQSDSAHRCTAETCETVPTVSRYWRNMVRKVARQTAPKLPSGGGSMPRLVISDDLRAEAAELELVDVDGARHMTAAEARQWLRVMKYERAESNMYSPWLDGRGDGIESVTGGHPTSMPMGIPSAGTLRAEWAERLARNVRSADDRAVLTAMLDSLAITRAGTSVIVWRTIHEALPAEARTRNGLRRMARREAARISNDYAGSAAPRADWADAGRARRLPVPEHATFAPVINPTRAEAPRVASAEWQRLAAEAPEVATPEYAACRHQYVDECDCATRRTVALAAQSARLAELAEAADAI